MLVGRAADTISIRDKRFHICKRHSLAWENSAFSCSFMKDRPTLFNFLSNMVPPGFIELSLYFVLQRTVPLKKLRYMQVISTEKLIVKKCCLMGFWLLNEGGDCQSLWLQMTTTKHRAKGRGKKIAYGKQKRPGRLRGYSGLGGWNRCEGFESHKTSVGHVGLKTKVTSLTVNLQCYHTYVGYVSIVRIRRELKISTSKNPFFFYALCTGLL